MLKIKNKALPSTLLCAALVLAATLASQPAHAFGKRPIAPPPPTPTLPPKPVTPPAPTPPPVSPAPSSPSGTVIRARWESVTRDGSSWSQYVYDQLPALAPNLLNKAPADIAQYCPAYSSLSTSDKQNFWVYLMSSITELESSFDPSTVYTESFTDSSGRLVQSIGLLQLSITDNAYGCGFASPADIKNADKNLACGLRILNKLVGQNGQLAGKNSAGSWQGGARYWSTLRNAKASQIQGWTKALRMCAN
jgi:hypothetical protein